MFMAVKALQDAGSHGSHGSHPGVPAGHTHFLGLGFLLAMLSDPSALRSMTRLDSHPGRLAAVWLPPAGCTPPYCH